MIDIGLDNTESVGVAHTALEHTRVSHMFVGDTESLGQSYLPALDNHHGLALVEHIQTHGVAKTPLDAAVHILLPVHLGKVGLGLGEQEGVHATVQMSVPRSGGIPSDHDDWANRAVLGDEASRVARGREDKDGGSVEIQRSPDSSHGARLNNRDGSLDESAHLLKVAHVGDRVLGLEARLAHLADGFLGIVALGGLTRQL